MTEAVGAPSRTRMVADEVRKRVGGLQRGYLADQSDAVATLARLRRCDPAEPGLEPSVWQVTIGGLPEVLAGWDTGISPAERAVHASLVLYALHQQSNSAPMHHNGIGLGHAVQRLAESRGHDGSLDQPSIRRLHQVVLSNDPSGCLYHLRGLITLLRSDTIPQPLDYGILAADLYRIFNPYSESSLVFARWGRELHSRPRETTTGESE